MTKILALFINITLLCDRVHLFMEKHWVLAAVAATLILLV